MAHATGHETSGDEVDMTTLEEALAQNALLREALEKIKGLLSAGNIDGATEVHKSVSLNDAWWQAENALSATPADCLRQVRAEVLEEAAKHCDTFIVKATIHDSDFVIGQSTAAEQIKAAILKDKPKRKNPPPRRTADG